MPTTNQEDYSPADIAVIEAVGFHLRWLTEKIGFPDLQHLQDKIVKAYSDPQRRYHNLLHLGFVLEHVLALLKTTAVNADYLTAELSRSVVHDLDVHATAVLAALYHDIEYNIDSSINEAMSTNRLLEAMQPLMENIEDGPLRHRLENIIGAAVWDIMATVPGNKALALSGEILQDADLLILAQDWPQYQQYVQNVREEYAKFTDYQWNIGRKAVLEKLLTTIDYCHAGEAATQQAKANITRELQSLPTF